jgi:cytochrome c2
MARFVRDEKRTFPFSWLIIGGLFAATAVWAGYDEMTRRVEWQEHQQRFFELDVELARKAKEAAQAEWDRAAAQDPLKSQLAEEAKLQADTEDKGSEYGKAKARLDELNIAFLAAESEKTFGASDLDEAYYYRNAAEYERDQKQVEVRRTYKEMFADSEPGRIEEPNKIYFDPPAPGAAADESAELHHIVSEIARNKAHAAGIDKALEAGGPAKLVAALRASKRAELEVVDKLEAEVKHQKHIDEARAKMAAIDGPADPVVAEKDPEKRDAAVKQARAEACAGKEDTRNCLRWLKLEPVDVKLKAITLAISKAKRTLADAEERFKNAEAKAHPKFDLKNPLGYLIGAYEIRQVVTTWLDFKRDVDIQQVDRCETCHLGTNKPTYTSSEIPLEFRTHPRRDLLMASHPVETFGCTSCHQGQGRATTQEHAHSAWRMHEHWGEERWHFDGDHYWEDPMLLVGKLAKVTIDDQNDELELKVGKKKTKVALDKKIYETEAELFGELKGKLQAALGEEAAGYNLVCEKVDNRVRIGLVAKDGADASKKPKSLGLSFTKLGLGKLLGFVGPYGNLARDLDSPELMLTAANPPSLPVRAENPKAQGSTVNTDKEYKYTPPNGAYGLQVGDEERNRFIQALPEVESGCLRCHATDPDLVPHRSHAQYVAAKLAYEKAEVERAHDPAGYAKAHGTDELPRVPQDSNEVTSLAPTLDQGRWLFRQLNCTGCHLLEGFENNKDAGPQLNDVSAKVKPEWLLSWMRYPRGFRGKTSMPNLWPAPLDPASKVPYQAGSPEHDKWKQDRADETLAIASFLYERSETVSSAAGPTHGAGKKSLREQIKGYADVDGASAESGKKLFESLGCQGCHANSEGAALPAEWRARERDVAPTLANIGGKSNADWIAYWVEDPTRYWHGTAMPTLRLSRKEAASVAKYLVSLKSEPPAQAEVTKEEADIVADPKRRQEQVPCVAAGGQKMSRVDCGEKTISQRGCFGCHRIGGFENNAPIGPELTGFAKKDVTTLDFGYALAEHNLQTTETFAALKLDSPRIFGRDRIELKMGDFDLSADEIRALVVFLKGTVPSTPTNDFNPLKKPQFSAKLQGRQLVNDLNCRGCHQLEGRGAEINGWREALLLSDTQQRAPHLDGEGARTQPEWLFDFLRDPGAHGIRPFLHPEWAGGEVPDDKLTIRMPTFKQLSAEQWTAVVRYFSTWDDQPYPFLMAKVGELSKDEKLWALGNMNSAETGNCQKCHFYAESPDKMRDPALIGRFQSELAAMAPNLAEMKHRLRPDWVSQWLLRPANYLKYTKMTAFFATANRPKDAKMWGDENDPFLSPPAMGWDAAVPGFRKLTTEDQANLLRDFLFTIPDGVAWPKKGEEKNSVMVDPEAAALTATADKEGEGKDKDAKDKDKGKGDKKPPQTGALPGPIRF